MVRRLAIGWKLLQSGYLWSALLLVVAVAVITGKLEAWQIAALDDHSIRTMLGVVLPLVTISVFAGLFAEDFEEGALSLVASYPLGGRLLLAERCLLGVVIMVPILLIYVGYVAIWIYPLDWRQWADLLADALPIHAVLAGWSLLWSLVGRGMVAGLAAGVGYWLVEMLTKGTWTRSLFLFESVWPAGADAMVHAIFLTLSPVICFCGAFCLFPIAGKRGASHS